MRRSRSQQPLTRETANPNAATAAASAFMKRGHSSTTSLSSAAAAAALKARPTTPTNVAEVQSKRALRRSPSVSSVGSRDKGRRDRQRSPSVSSMTERSFRSPSPGRGQPIPHDAPPVPQIPKETRHNAAAASPRSAQTVQTQPFRTASQKMKDGQKPTWFGAAAPGDPNNVRKSDAVLRSPYSPTSARPGSVSPSINFSYPSKSESPDDMATPSDEPQLVYDPNSRRMVPKIDLLQREASVREAAEKPVKKKKKQDLSRSGSHLSKGTMGRTVTSSLVESNLVAAQTQPPKVEDSSPANPKQYTQPTGQSVSSRPSSYEPRHEAETDSRIPEPEPAAATSLETNDEPGPELESELITSSETSAPTQQVGLQSAREGGDASHVAREPGATQVLEQPLDEAKGLFVEKPNFEADSHGRDRTSRARVHSESPARTAHFAPPSDQLVVRHEPPPRSLSPRKSALKYRSPTRGASPSDSGSEASMPVNPANSKDELDTPRKKAVRVSFDDQNTVIVGESVAPVETESPVIPSPQVSKKPWHSLVGRYTRKDATPLDEEETMGPRPVLPAFGSVREKKAREPEERPLVRPSERAWSPPASSALRQASLMEDETAGNTQSNEQSSRNAANISKYREPLPPVVTSIEESGYVSNSDSGSDDESEDDQTIKHIIPNRRNPDITICEPTPQGDDDKATEATGFFDIPGGFPSDDDSIDRVTAISASEAKAPEPAASKIEIRPSKEPERPVTETSSSMDPSVLRALSSPMTDIQEAEESSDNDSIYSDAYEDLSEAEGDGFMSLDTVLAQSSDPASRRSLEMIPEINTKIKHMASQNTSATKPDTEANHTEKSSPSQNDWENAKAYWKSLSPEDRRRLEKELGQESAQIEAKPAQKKEEATGNVSATSKVSANPAKSRDRVYQIQPGTKWEGDNAKSSPVGLAVSKPANGNGSMKLRKSMRQRDSGSDDTSGAKSGMAQRSMRSGNSASTRAAGKQAEQNGRAHSEVAAFLSPNGMRKSMRGGETNGRLKQAARPVSYQPPSAVQPVKDARRPLSVDGRQGPAAGIDASRKLTRRGSDASVSSFTRDRAGHGEGFGFRKSMRGSLQEAPSEPTKGSSRFSLRSLSPTGSRRGSVSNASPSMGGRMRQSLRSTSTDSAANRIRMPSFGRSSGKKAKKKAEGSRFADSSDEEGGPSSNFRSRFADSSDEEDIPVQQPAKSMRPRSSGSAAAAAMSTLPVQKEEVESPDLPDSDDETQLPKRNEAFTNGNFRDKPVSGLHRSGSGRGNLAAGTGTLALGTQVTGNSRPKSTRRGSFMSTVLRRKTNDAGKISRNLSESAARRDTKLERSTEELTVIRSNSNGNNRLQRRAPSWPLPDETLAPNGAQNGHNLKINNDIPRPSTANAAAPSAKRSGFLRRRSTSQGVVSFPINAAVSINEAQSEAGTPRKKRFGTLRKMFKLHD
ncbi:hypothetical protein B0I35DRAFT_354332 [Stachybotrys elegans]|uniref:Uncharacterized protein n=1 Tax=Stachybotrys elegans TaxID=80388 RepID=A0A8K0WRF7_9HYPO|nr:hypothetical protein B0I35DRAFT_354332 [Stachybotrys elegans]